MAPSVPSSWAGARRHRRCRTGKPPPGKPGKAKWCEGHRALTGVPLVSRAKRDRDPGDTGKGLLAERVWTVTEQTRLLSAVWGLCYNELLADKRAHQHLLELQKPRSSWACGSPSSGVHGLVLPGSRLTPAAAPEKHGGLRR